MNNRVYKRKKIIFTGIIALLIWYLVDMGSFGYFYTNIGSDTMHYSAGHGTGALVVSITTAVLLLILSVIISKRKIQLSGYGLVFCLFALTMVYSLITLVQYGARTLLAGTASCYSYFLVFAVFIGADDDYWQFARRAMLLTGLGAIIASFVYSLIYLKQYGGLIGNSPQIIYLSAGFFPLAIFAMSYKQDKKIERTAVYLGFGLAFLVSMIYGTRGWTVQSILFLLVYIFKANNEKTQTSALSKTLSKIVVTAMLFIGGWIVVESFFSEELTYLIGRISQNTRLWQYTEIFSQMDVASFFFGKGQEATYVSSLYGDYKFIDNTFIYLLFHFGFFFMLSYLLLIIKGIRVAYNKNKYKAFTLFMWFLALNGLSVYCVPSIDLKCLFTYMLIGNCINEIRKETLH